MQWSAFDDRNVRVILAWPEHYANTAVAEIGGYPVISNHGPTGGAADRGETADTYSVEVTCPPALYRSGRRQIGIRATGGELCPVTCDSKHVSRVSSGQG